MVRPYRFTANYFMPFIGQILAQIPQPSQFLPDVNANEFTPRSNMCVSNLRAEGTTLMMPGWKKPKSMLLDSMVPCFLVRIYSQISCRLILQFSNIRSCCGCSNRAATNAIVGHAHRESRRQTSAAGLQQLAKIVQGSGWCDPYVHTA